MNCIGKTKEEVVDDDLIVTSKLGSVSIQVAQQSFYTYAIIPNVHLFKKGVLLTFCTEVVNVSTFVLFI